MTLPIKKTILASLAFIVMHWKKIIEISIIPLILASPLLLVLPELIMELSKQLLTGQVDTANVPDNTPLYVFFFLYGYALLSINLVRLIMLGESSVSALSCVFEFGRIAKYVGLTMMVGFAIVLPVALTGVLFVELIVYFLIVPLTLNFVNVAIGRVLNFRLSLPFVVHISLYFMQVLLPTLFAYLFGSVADALGLSGYFSMLVQVFIFYWSGINLAFCYRVIVADSSEQSL
ncbi:MAG: hypothetical protein NZ775_06390 [Gammaproteobacteria bacterium]|nr:hypothetical protein [Gammaproteobacteria bacterium]